MQTFISNNLKARLLGIDIDRELKTRYKYFGETHPKFSKQLQTFCEASTVKIGKHGKVGDYRAPFMFVGYSHDPNDNGYHLYNVRKKKSETVEVYSYQKQKTPELWYGMGVYITKFKSLDIKVKNEPGKVLEGNPDVEIVM